MKRRKPLPEPGRRDPAVARWWFGLVVLAGASVLLDLFLIGMPLLALSLLGVLAIGLLAQAVFRLFGRNRREALRPLLRVLLLVACGALSFFFCQGQVATGRQGARAIAAALDAHFADHGRYPQQLSELVPDYLPALPSTGYRYSAAPFMYDLGPEGQPTLVWTLHALGGTARYDFSSGLIRYGD